MPGLIYLQSDIESAKSKGAQKHQDPTTGTYGIRARAGKK
jgi:hypothetical protein